MMSKKKPTIKTAFGELEALNSFIGSQCYYNVLGARITEGVKYVMENGYSWFVTDALAVIMTKWNLRNADFLVIRLNVETPIF